MPSPFETMARGFRGSSMLPFPFSFMMAPFAPQAAWKPNTVMEPFPEEMKATMMQMAGVMSPWSMRQMFNMMTFKRKVKPGVAFDDVIVAMDSRAIEVNLKKIGHSPLSKAIAAKTGKPTPRIEVLQYCDALVLRKMLDYAPEFSIFVPCRISVLEDANDDIWLMTMDWNVAWLQFAWHPDSQLPVDLKADSDRIREAMRSIIDAGVNGDWG